MLHKYCKMCNYMARDEQALVKHISPEHPHEQLQSSRKRLRKIFILFNLWHMKWMQSASFIYVLID